jgi:hypothetical protein
VEHWNIYFRKLLNAHAADRFRKLEIYRVFQNILYTAELLVSEPNNEAETATETVKLHMSPATD